MQLAKGRQVARGSPHAAMVCTALTGLLVRYQRHDKKAMAWTIAPCLGQMALMEC